MCIRDRIYRTTGKCHLHVHAVAADQNEAESFLHDVIDSLPGVISVSTNVILTRIKDIKGCLLYTSGGRSDPAELC